jgi:hypothetical protein
MNHQARDRSCACRTNRRISIATGWCSGRRRLASRSAAPATPAAPSHSMALATAHISATAEPSCTRAPADPGADDPHCHSEARIIGRPHQTESPSLRPLRRTEASSVRPHEIACGPAGPLTQPVNRWDNLARWATGSRRCRRSIIPLRLCGSSHGRSRRRPWLHRRITIVGGRNSAVIDTTRRARRFIVAQPPAGSSGEPISTVSVGVWWLTCTTLASQPDRHYMCRS